MKSVGIICEYNPFHHGHLIHLNTVKQMYPNDAVVLVLSGNFTERGDVSIINKWDKTKIALDFGVDLVVELPFAFTVESADIFARGAIEILNHLHVETLVLGSESDDVQTLSQLADIQLTHPEYHVLVKKYVKDGVNYPTALSRALTNLTGTTVNSPNDILGLSYIREIKRLKSTIKPVSIKRTNHYLEQKLEGKVSSATSIRLALKEQIDIAVSVPEEVLPYLHEPIFVDDLFPILKGKLVSEMGLLSLYHSVQPELLPIISKKIVECDTLDSFLQQIKSKNITYQKLKRMMIHILCGYLKEEVTQNQQITYLRILGFSDVGQQFLKERKKSVAIPILTNYDERMSLELRVTKVYALLFSFEKQKQIIQMEYQNKPIKKNDIPHQL